ncbi:MAG: biotin transporter BioY [Clostridia bacterium]|nr:biotin transporter BioY [Clostridia bacterium]
MSENRKKLTKSFCMNWSDIAIFVVGAFFLAISSQVSIPLPNGVPMTLQTFSVALVGYCLSSQKGIKTILSYLFLGIIGIPVFAQAKSGIPTLLGLTGGFLFGFIFFVYCCSKAKKAKNLISKLAISAIGLLLCHLLGVLQYSILTNTNLIYAASLVSIPFLLKDFFSVLLAFLVSEKLNLDF